MCPYHGWTYNLDGALRSAHYTLADFDRSDFALGQARLEVLHGMIFINFAEDPAPLTPSGATWTTACAPTAWTGPRSRTGTATPSGPTGNSRWRTTVNVTTVFPPIPNIRPAMAARGRTRKWLSLRTGSWQGAREAGLTEHRIDKSWLDAGAVGIDRGFDRYPLFDGFVTGSRDGKPVAPLLGEIRAYDGGATDIQVGPFTFMLAYCDHVVIYHFRPLGAAECACDITWLVNETAQAGKDYDKDDLTWLWDVTTVADKRIIENNQAGINSAFYQPGPYTAMESFTRGFIDWYLDTMK